MADTIKEVKRCSRCELEKAIDEFGIVDGGPYCQCKKCVAEKTRIWYSKNKEKARKRDKEYAAKNPEKLANIKRKHYLKNRQKIIDRSAASYSERYETDPQFRVEMQCRKRVRHLMSATGKKTRSKSMDLIGTNKEGLMKHIESLFQSGMSWDNYGYRGWHVDHIRPCASFDLSDPEQQKVCFHYTNLQPLWAIDNFQKSDKYDN